ncbi:Uncharacterised protein [Serratia fonticola]|uniref:Uncharacterized protein n=1 Tax=Serratia fonticola TaxID=47917 RepID=A0A4U9VR41_SERFO|nr:Uncharacterised protein [Serratia fonticola]
MQARHFLHKVQAQAAALGFIFPRQGIETFKHFIQRIVGYAAAGIAKGDLVVML